MADQVIDLNLPSGSRREVFIKRISWAAIFSGVLVALGVEVLFLTFGSFIGFRMAPGAGASAWSVAWTFFGAFISFFAGGWVAGNLGGNPETGRAHGLVTWGLATVATFAFVALVSWGVVSQTMGVVRTAALAASNVAGSTTAEANRMGSATAPGASSADRTLEAAGQSGCQPSSGGMALRGARPGQQGFQPFPVHVDCLYDRRGRGGDRRRRGCAQNHCTGGPRITGSGRKLPAAGAHFPCAARRSPVVYNRT